MPRGATVSSSAAILDILSISEKDSALIENIPDLIANAISCSDLPTPEKINFPASTPAEKHLCISPADTTSKQQPSSSKIFKI